jgi:four helix bundle protein
LKRREVEVVGDQLLRAGTSVGALYREASRARSKADFISKVEHATQEADESQFWLELLHDDCGIRSERMAELWNESNELISIFVAMVKNAKRSD